MPEYATIDLHMKHRDHSDVATGAPRTFGLIPGGMHGSWCWRELVRELELRGHRAIPVQPPLDDQAAGLQAYADSAARQLAGASGLTLVGHSMASGYLPLAANAMSAASIVFLSALVPQEGLSLLDLAKTFPGAVTMPFDGLTLDELGRSVAHEGFARDYYFDDVPAPLADWAIAQLRPQPTLPTVERFPVGGWPDIPATLVLGLSDRCISMDWGRRLSRELLGRAVVEMPGGHSPFLSRPAELADILVSLD